MALGIDTLSPVNSNLTLGRNADSVIISVQYAPGETVYFFYMNDYDDPVRVFKAVDSTGFLRMTLYTPHNLLVIFTEKSTLYPVLIIPGDNLFVRKSVKNEEHVIEFSSTKHVYANFLSEVEKNYGFHIASLQYSKGMNVGYYLKDIEEKNSKRLKLLQEYENKDIVGESVENSVLIALRRELKFRYILDFCLPYFNKEALFYQIQTPDYIAKMKTFISEFNCDECVTSYKYRLAVRNYLRCMSPELLSKGLYLPETLKNANQFSGKTRDVALFNSMKEYIEKNKKGAMKFLSDFNTKCSNEGYKHYIDSLNKRDSNLLESEDALTTKLSDLDGKEISLKTILSAQKGKIVLLDFWASWCAPCRAETPAMKKLIEKYTDKDVAVVFISVDRDKTKWLDAISQMDIRLAGEHYLLDQNKSLMKMIGIPPIPRYVLIDKEGRMAAFNAPRPSDINLMLMIDKMIGSGGN